MVASFSLEKWKAKDSEMASQKHQKIKKINKANQKQNRSLLNEDSIASEKISEKQW